MKSAFALIFVFAFSANAFSQDTTNLIDRFKLGFEAYDFYIPSNYQHGICYQKVFKKAAQRVIKLTTIHFSTALRLLACAYKPI